MQSGESNMGIPVVHLGRGLVLGGIRCWCVLIHLHLPRCAGILTVTSLRLRRCGRSLLLGHVELSSP